MKRIKTGSLLLAVVLFGSSVIAQSVDQAKKFMYYERYKSAKTALQPLVSSTPLNEEAAYLYGQAEIGLEQLKEAGQWYQKNLQTNPNSALLTAGAGHVLLLEGKAADARMKFESAISLSGGKSIPVLNAIGFANSNPDTKNGDAAYAVDVLTRATKIKGFKDPEVLTNLGDAYRKLGDGGNAVLSYDAALRLNPNYVRALYRKGKLYQTQGVGQEDLYMTLYNDAISKDPAYAPVYGNLFNYFYSTNVPRSADYLDQWLKYSDDDPKACFYRASMKYAQGLFNDALSASDACIAAEGENAYPNLYGLKALSYMKLKDTVNARTNYETFFKVQDPEKIGAGDYATYALLMLNNPADSMKVETLTAKAVEIDSIEANKLSYIRNLAKSYESKQQYNSAANWYARVMKVRRNYSNVDLFNAGYNYYLADKMDSSVVYFTEYAQKYPEDIMGHYMLGNANAIIDSTGELGLAVPHYEKTIQIAELDTTKPNVKTRLLTAYRFFIGYYYNTKKDQKQALNYIEKALALAPEDQQLLTFKEFVTNNDPAAPRRGGR